MRQFSAKPLLLYLVFVVSGFSGLGYQMVWSRLFALGLGHELPGVLATVAAFFAGLALGAWISDAMLDRSSHPGFCYAAIELLIGLWGFASVLLIPKGNDLAINLIGLEPSGVRHWTVAFLVPLFVLLPATVAMGATMPVMERFLASCAGQGRRIGVLYAANTLGALGGTLLTTFALLPGFGFAATLKILAVLNLICGVVSLLIPSRTEAPAVRPELAEPGKVSTSRIGATVFVTGLLGIGFEVAGMRVLSEVLENTIYTFAAVLAIYLTGTAIGAGLYQRFGRDKPFESLLRRVLLGISIACLLGTLVLSKAEFIYEKVRAFLGDSSWGVVVAEMFVAAALFGLPTIVMGAAFSQLVQFYRDQKRRIGHVVALNTLGSAIAPAVFGVILFPVLGSKWTLVLISCAFLSLLPKLSSRQWGWLCLPLLLVLLLLPTRIQFVAKPPGGELLEYRAGVMDSVAVVKHFDGNRSLLVNNRFTMGGTGAASAARRHAHIPLLLHPQPRRALFLGLGTGITFAGAAPHFDLEADGVELIPEVVEVQHHFEPFNSLRPGLRLHVADARRFVRSTAAQYDVIVADLFHPARDGAGMLYTLEHFRSIRDRLSAGGLFCQWLPLYQLDEAMVRVITRTFVEVFPNTRAFLLRFNIDTPVLGLIGTIESVQYPVDWFEKRVRLPELQKELRALSLGDEFQLFGCFLASTEALRKFAGDAPLNTDDHPIVMFGAPEFSYRRTESSHGRLFALLNLNAAEPPDLIQQSGASESERFTRELAAFIAARDLYLRGLLLESEGRQPEAWETFLASARKSPAFSTAYAHCLTLAMQQSKTNPEAARRLLEKLAEAQPDRPVARELLKKLFGE